jgi:guanylate kinase
MAAKTRRGLLIILSSPSGAGKSTLSRMLLEADDSLRFSVSATTRHPRPGEVEGEDYYFKSPEEFETMVANGEMLEHATVFGHMYGSPRGPVEDAVSIGRDILFDVDWQGGQQIRSSIMQKDVVSIFILPPSLKELERRLVARSQDSAEVVAARMAQSRSEISHWEAYDYVLINDDLDVCFERLKTVLKAAHLRRDARPELMEHVSKLNSEFEDMS